MKDKCPMCGSTNHKLLTTPPFKQAPNYTTEVSSCQECPCVWFEYHDQSDWMQLGDALGLHEVEQI